MRVPAYVSFLLLLVACPAAPVAEKEAEPPLPEDADGDGFDVTTDCDDADPAVNPAATEVCGGGDEDCDGLVDDADPGVSDTEEFFLDRDGDGRGDKASPTYACVLPMGAAERGKDCDDTDAAIHPAAPEVCNGWDDDCDGKIDDEDSNLQSELVLYPDRDGDGRGDGGDPREVCGPISGWGTDDTDPDDDDASVWLPPDVYMGDLTEDWSSFCEGYLERDLGGDLDLSTATEADIDALSCLRSVSGDIFAWFNPTLTRLSGFPRLTDVGGSVDASFNPELATISGFAALEEVGSWFAVIENPRLGELSGFESLTRVEHEMHLKGSAELSDIAGFSALERVGVLFISGHPALLDVSGFDALEYVGGTSTYPNGHLYVSGNPALRDISGFPEFAGTTSVSINGNASLVEITGFGEFVYAEHFSLSDNPSLSSSSSVGRFGFDVDWLVTWAVSGNSSLCESVVEARLEALERAGFTGSSTITGNLEGC